MNGNQNLNLEKKCFWLNLAERANFNGSYKRCEGCDGTEDGRKEFKYGFSVLPCQEFYTE
jgi:hypothetical protein